MLKHIQARQDWNEKSFSAKGFTLIELLVVIVILGVLSAVVVFSVRGVTNDSRDASCKTELRTIVTAGEAYYAQNGSYPTSVAQLISAGLLNDSINTTVAYTFGTNGYVTQGTCPV